MVEHGRPERSALRGHEFDRLPAHPGRLPLHHRAFDGRADRIELAGLRDIGDGSVAHRLNGRLHGWVARQQHRREIRPAAVHLLEQVQAAVVRQIQVGHHRVQQGGHLMHEGQRGGHTARVGYLDPALPQCVDQRP